MQRVEEPMETIHLYVVREEEKRPYSLLPLFFAFLCLLSLVALTLYSGEHPLYEHETLRIPAQFLPPEYFSVSEPIIPTGIKTYPATNAHGTLTLTNGSVVSQEIPKGLIFAGKDGVEVVTDAAVFLPAGSADGYGVATVSAHAVVAGEQGNIAALDINLTYGTAMYIRNLSSFHGGKRRLDVPIVTPQDKQMAIENARIALARIAQMKALFAYPCKQTAQVKNSVVGLSMACQYVTYSVPSYMKVTHIRLVGKNLLVDVIFVAHPHVMVVK